MAPISSCCPPLFWAGRRGSAASSASTSEQPPDRIEKINDSLYELASTKGHIELDVVFFHGLQFGDYKEAYWKTWSTEDGKIWPQTILARAFPEARILSVCYDSSARKSGTKGNMDMHNIGKLLLYDIILSPQAEVGRENRAVVLIGHSLGGLVIKQFLLHAWQESHAIDRNKFQKKASHIDNFLQNVKGIFYYSTPHGGSDLANYAKSVPFVNRGPCLDFLTVLNKKAGRLNEDFRRWRSDEKKAARTIYEDRDTQIWNGGPSFRIVTEASAGRDTDDSYQAPGTDHFTVCKARDEKSAPFQHLEDFIDTQVQGITHITHGRQGLT